MNRRISSRMIILKNQKVLLFKRTKRENNQERIYYAIPGGGLEENETLEECAMRELKEEMQVDTKILGYVGMDKMENEDEYFFHGEIISGIPTLGGEEKERNCSSNQFEIVWIEEGELESIDLLHIDKIRCAMQGIYQDKV